MIKFRVLLILLLIVSLKTKACECSNLDWADWSTEAVHANIKHSDVIFIGELLTSTKENYSFRIKTVFKGDLKNNTTFFGQYFDSCSGRPNLKRAGLWIVYGNYYQDYESLSGYDISTCGLTRSLFFPVIYNATEHCKNGDEELCILNQTFNKDIQLELGHKK